MPRRGRPNTAVALERARRAFELHTQGRSIPEIAAQLDVTPDGARRILQRLDRRALAGIQDEAERLRQVSTSTAVRLAADGLRSGHVEAAIGLLDSLAKLWPAPAADADPV